MRTSIAAAGSAAALGMAVILSLTGCAPAVHPADKAAQPHPTQQGSAATRPPATGTPEPKTGAPSAGSPSAGSPSAGSLGPLPANALFRITATVTEPTGPSADLSETVFAPAGASASDTALLNAQCNLSGQPTWQSAFTNPRFVTTTITAKLRPGSAPWPVSDQVAAYFLSSMSAYSGGYTPAESGCAPGYISIPGTMHGVAPVDGAEPATGSNGWAAHFRLYGFDGGGNDPGAPDESGTGVVSNCEIVESAAAEATSAAVSHWLTQPFVLANGCAFQGVGQ